MAAMWLEDTFGVSAYLGGHARADEPLLLHTMPAAGSSITAQLLPAANVSAADNTSTTCEPLPRHLPGDYVKICYLLLLFIVGATVNLVAYCTLRRSTATLRNQSTLITAGNVVWQLHQLKRQLNLANLLVIFVHCLSDLLWHITYEWHGGAWLCKLVQFGRVFAYYLCSNVIVCIALNRYLTVFPINAVKPQLRVQIMIASAWLIALGCSLPQFWFWTTIKHPMCNGTFVQCVNVWDLVGAEQRQQHAHAQQQQAAYALAHLLAVFFIPLGIIVLCYGLLICRIPNACNLFSCCRRSHIYTQCEQLQVESAAPPQSTRLTVEPSTAAARVTFQHNDQLYPQQQNGGGGAKGCIGESLSSLCASAADGYRAARSKAIGVSLMLIVSYVGCNLPYNVLQLCKIYLGHSVYASNEWLQAFDNLNVLTILNALINPFIYGVFSGPILLPRCMLIVNTNTPPG